ncbi:uncharacterized protein VP01_191g10 [Puccinia sorghi]|uniref:BED-type domain-containing protein n=1 Tax=Puccinia sorghi TaxID=27349 RepID=A0A0L6VCI9_9BASI|nr:uncharacterized protein VP01_191g10 [Puccinia sorghi]
MSMDKASFPALYCGPIPTEKQGPGNTLNLSYMAPMPDTHWISALFQPPPSPTQILKPWLQRHLISIPKKSWVWQYFKTVSIENVHWKIWSVLTNHSTKSMSKHLQRQHRISSNHQEISTVTHFMKAGDSKAPKKLS